MIPELYQAYLSSTGVETDTRKALDKKIFFALKGDNFDGNEYAEKALEQGALLAVIDEPKYQNENTMLVDDVLSTLQELGLYHRRKLNIPIIAITGSNGKTTTKELVQRVMCQKYKTTATEGNFNNHIGIPLTLLSIPTDTEYAIVEMGANHQGEIHNYCQYTEPNYGLITNIGKAHLEGFGGIEGVRKGKGELYEYLRAHEGFAFVCSDLDDLMEMSKDIPRYTYGSHPPADLVGTLSVSKGPYIRIRSSETTIDTQMTGAYNLPNILAALCIGQFFKIPMTDMQKAISTYAPDNSRSQILIKGKHTIILDAYNANPSSMRLALRNFAGLDNQPKIAILGGMKELGTSSAEEHQTMIDLSSSLDIDHVILIGDEYGPLDHQSAEYYESKEAAGERLQKLIAQDDFDILIKGSRSMKMEELIEYIK